jgi:pimeloyl-ACP methyl ester carboxylesterase
VNGLVFCATSSRLQDIYGTERVTDLYLAALSGVARTTDQLAAIPAAGARLLRRARAHRPASFLEWAAAEFRRHDIRMLVESARTSARFDSSGWIGEVNVPTSVVLTTRDRMVRPDAQEQLANAIYGAEVIELNAGHMACARPSFAQPMLEACRDVSLRAG